MKDILDIISNYNMDICEFFNQYNKRKKDNTLYSKDDYIPQNLIKLYYLDKYHFDFKKIIEEFRYWNLSICHIYYFTCLRNKT